MSRSPYRTHLVDQLVEAAKDDATVDAAYYQQLIDQGVPATAAARALAAYVHATSSDFEPEEDDA